MLASLAHLIPPLARLAGRRGIIINNHTQTGRQMRMQVEALGRHFEFIGHDELPRAMERGSRRKPFCLFTFDDGKRVNCIDAAPELLKLGVPAVFYIVSDAATHGRAMLFDKVNALRNEAADLPAELGSPALKRLPYSDAVQRVEEACRHYGVAPDMTDPAVQPMTWDEVRVLHSNGFTIGAHGRQHAILTRVAEDAALTEIKESTQAVSDALGVPCRSFAFPNGNHTERLAQFALECGVDTAMTTDPRWVTSSSALWRLPRIQLYDKYDAGRVIAKVLAALPGCLLKNPNQAGSGTY